MLPEHHNVIWGTPSRDAAGSMPLGNGTNGLNLWVEPNGDLRFYLSRTDSWGEFGQLYKVGRVRVRLFSREGQPLLKGSGFRWELKLQDGAIEVRTDHGWVRVWVDAHHSVVQVLAGGPETLTGSISLDLWRTERRQLASKTEHHSLHTGAPYPVYHEKDHVADLDGDQLVWYHHNETSTWEACLRQQGLEKLLESETDPLLHRCFGGLVHGEGLRKISANELVSVAPGPRFTASVSLHCAQLKDPGQWIREIQSLAASGPGPCDSHAWDAHCAWWRAFWDRSWIDADGCEAARKISRGYTLQRFMNACSGRGAFPIKFNGSIFTVDWQYDADGGLGSEAFDADYRRWGPAYWHQNTRLPYWSMLYAGDFEMMRPYFDMYLRALPAARERVRRFCGHEGATFPETMYFWGAYIEHNYGWDPASGAEPARDPDLPGHLSQNQYIRFHNSSGLEVVYLGLLLYRFHGDEAFLKETLLPLAKAVISYYDQHFPRRNGRLHITPAQVIEQWWVAENPLPEIAGLRACLDALLDLPDPLCPQRKDWERLKGELPGIPASTSNGTTVFSPAESWEGPHRNTENPELYAVFPYHLCHLEADTLADGIETFRRRIHTHDRGWAQDGMQAALLGLTQDARNSVTNRLTVPSAYARFPAFWGPGFDWIPDQDQGGSAAHAFQLMVLQAIGDHLHLLPAWPASWSLDFKLAGPHGTSIQGSKAPGQPPTFTVSGQHKDRVHVVCHGA